MAEPRTARDRASSYVFSLFPSLCLPSSFFLSVSLCLKIAVAQSASAVFSLEQRHGFGLGYAVVNACISQFG